MEAPTATPFAWYPTPDYVNHSVLQQFMDAHGLDSLDALMDRSTKDIGWFWEAVLTQLDIQFYRPYEKIVDTSAGIPWTQWCVGGQMNIAHNCLDKWMGTSTQNRAALRWEGEEGQTRTLTYGDLLREVNRVANGLRALGLGRGDAIGLYMPMTPEIAIALLAIAKIGAVILPLFSGFGEGAIVSRLADANAKALFTADGAPRRGKVVAMKPVADAAVAQVPTIQHVIVQRRAGNEIAWTEGRDIWWSDLVAGQPLTAETTRTDADETLMIIYTSGTTGRPKGAVHSHCGFPIKAAQDMAHGMDMQSSDTMYWVSDMGWMMGPWELFGTLLLGGTMLFYDGAPDYPQPDRLWSLIERHGVTIFGVSPTLVRALIPHGEEIVRAHDLSSLRILGSTGEPWNPEPWWWFFRHVGQGRCPIINYSGGTEISGGIVMGNVLTPVKPCAFSGVPPGMAVDVVDEDGNSVRGQVGELVIRQPWIGMTRGFWRDRARYLAAYWSRFPNLWVHGDWALVDGEGQWYILGRSDDTIKVAGKRVGPAEVESILVNHPAVVEAAAIGIPDELKGQVVVVFCVLVPGTAATPALAAALQAWVAQELGKPLQPRDILFVADLPKTRSAKVMRRVIKAAYLGENAGDLSSLANPGAVEAIRQQAVSVEE
ncbi:MAG: AMP-binding protein [Anaerolineales bacterium]|nr:AMP-binding protein [Anaerolineales bacterium]